MLGNAHTTFFSFLFVGVGGALGAMARFALNVMLQSDHAYPWGTKTANLVGCFILGVVAHLVATSAWFNDSGLIPDQYRLLFAVGFAGSFTTLSAMMLEMHTMMERSQILSTTIYLITTIVGGFLCFMLGLVLARSVGNFING